MQQHSRNYVLWFDKNVNSAENQQTAIYLDTAGFNVQVYQDISNFNKDFDLFEVSDGDSPIIVISSGSFGKEIAELLKNKKFLGMVIYCGNVNFHQKWIQD